MFPNKFKILFVPRLGRRTKAVVLTNRAAAAGQTAATAVLPVVVVQASLAVGAVRVVGAVPTVATVACGAVQFSIVVALGTLTIAVAGCGGAKEPGGHHSINDNPREPVRLVGGRR